jgi:hypothetical protein
LLYVEEGKAVQGLGSDAVKTALVYLSRLVNEDKTVYLPAALYDVDNWGIYDDSEAWRCFLDGNVAFLVQSGAVLSRQLRGKVSFDYGLLPLPAGPDAVGYAMSAQNSTLLCISETHRTPERAAILLNALMRPLSEGAHMQAVRDTCLQPGDTRSLMSYRVCLDSGAVDLGYAITPMVESLHFMAARLVLWGHDPDTVEAVDFSKEIDAVY